MRKSIFAPLVASAVLGGCAACPKVPPPVPVEIRVAVPTPCTVPEPACQRPAFDSAQRGQPGDVKVRLLRVEAAQQAECLVRYRAALAACREAENP